MKQKCFALLTKLCQPKPPTWDWYVIKFSVPPHSWQTDPWQNPFNLFRDVIFEINNL